MHRYTPILQIKEGELKALQELLLEDKTKIIPLIQLLPDNLDDRKGNYVSDRLKPLIEGWSFLDNRLYVDPYILGDAQLSLTQSFFEHLKNNGINVIPVVRPNSWEHTRDFTKDYCLHGICLRITGSFMSAEIINEWINFYKVRYKLEDSEIDLLIDFSVTSDNNEMSYYNSFENIFRKITSLKSLRKIIVAAGSFPFDLGKFAKDTITAIPRAEWTLWKRIEQFVKGEVPLVYSDYGNVYPIYDPEGAKRRGTCSIKYTDSDSFYIFKGEQAKNSKLSTGQYQVKASQLIEKSYYSGNTFSWGDQYIMDCAHKREKPGGSTTWVKITQNHHFVKTLRLL